MSNIDSKINELFETIKHKKAELVQLEKESRAAWATNCSISLGEHTPINIQTAKDSVVLTIVRELLIHRQYTQEASKLLGLSFDDKYQNFSYDDWVADCKKRLSVLSIKDKRTQLDDFEKRLDKIVSPERRRELELQSITSSLGALA